MSQIELLEPDPVKMTAEDVKDAIRRRHPATQFMGGRKVPGQWTVIPELNNIDLVAFSAVGSPQPSIGVRYPRIGYEVKVSRADLRRELLKPSKRAYAVSWCHAFYIATPKGLLSREELAFEEPEWGPEDFVRSPCPERQRDWDDDSRCYKGRTSQLFIGPLPMPFQGRHPRPRWRVDVPCETCGGKGYLDVSRVEREAPTLWVPRDVGLIEVDGAGCKIRKKAPVNRDVPDTSPQSLAWMVRWVSARPDPRHYGLVQQVAPEAE